MKTFLKFLAGCIAIPIALVLILVVVALVFRMAGAPEHRPETASIEQRLEPVTIGQLQAEGLATPGAPLGKPIPVHILMEEGNFTIRPGPPGSAIRVEGDYDAGVYELKQEVGREDDGTPSYRLSFRPRYSLFRRIAAEGLVNIDEDDNRMTVWLPQGLPMALDGRFSKGKTTMELGGLAIERARLDLKMGEHSLSVSEPNALEMSSFEVSAGMGEINLTQLGNLRSQSLTIFARMGEANIDFGETISRDTKMYTRMRMGEMSVSLPSEARVRARTSAFLGESNGSPNDPDRDAAGRFALDLDASVSFGEIRYHRR